MQPASLLLGGTSGTPCRATAARLAASTISRAFYHPTHYRPSPEHTPTTRRMATRNLQALPPYQSLPQCTCVPSLHAVCTAASSPAAFAAHTYALPLLSWPPLPSTPGLLNWVTCHHCNSMYPSIVQLPL